MTLQPAIDESPVPRQAGPGEFSLGRISQDQKSRPHGVTLVWAIEEDPAVE